MYFHEILVKLYHCFDPLFSICITEIRGGLAKGFRIKGVFGLISFFLRPTKEDVFLKSLNFKNQTVYDIGGHVGIFTMFFSREVEKGRVITFEPLEENVNSIKENLLLNNILNVEVMPMGLGRIKKEAELVVGPSSTASASFQEDIKSDILKDKKSRTIKVMIDTLDNQIHSKKLPIPSFIKIDVEGMELEVLKGMTETIKIYKPKLFIEIHGANDQKKIENARMVVIFLELYAYKMLHVETETNIDMDNFSIAREGHLYCY